jgi:putative acetyltransferase
MKFRKIQKEDNPFIAKIIRANLEKYSLNIKGTAYFDECLDNLFAYYNELPLERQYWVLLDDNDNVVGGAGFANLPYIDGCCELQKIYLIDEYKGQGYGLRLLELVIDNAKMVGYNKMYLETHDRLELALKLYLKYGFNEIEKPDFVVHSTMNKFLIKDI